MATPTPTTIDGLPTLTINALNAASSIDAVNDLLLIYQNSSTSTLGINRNTLLGISSAPLGLTDTQSPTNKTFNNTNTLTVKDSNLILQYASGVTSQATFSLANITAGQTRVITLPNYNGTIATLAGTETLTNKTLTSPTINSPTITNATISSDAITGYTTSSTGTIYGLSITSGTIGSAGIASGAITSTQLGSGAVTNAAIAAAGLYATKIYNPYKFSVYWAAGEASYTSSGTGVIVKYDTITFDSNNNFSTSTHIYTVPLNGYYQFNHATQVNNGGNPGYANASYNIGGTNYQVNQQALSASSSDVIVGNGWYGYLTAGTSVSVYIGSSSIWGVVGGNNNTWFSGYLVSAT